jgi:hypothetical protein
MKEKADLRSHLLAIQITEKVLVILTRQFVFLEYESNQGEHGGSRNCLRGEVGIYARSDDLVAISLCTRDNNMVDDMEPVLQEPLKLCCAWGELLQPLMVDVPKV